MGRGFLLHQYYVSNRLLAGGLSSRLLAGYLAAWPAASLARWLAGCWLAGGLPGELAAGWLAGWPADKNDPLPENLRQMEISIALSPDAPT